MWMHCLTELCWQSTIWHPALQHRGSACTPRTKGCKHSPRHLLPAARERSSDAWVYAAHKNPPLALISSLLSLLQLGQGSGQTLLSTIQLLLNQLDTSVKGSDISLSLRREEEHVRGEIFNAQRGKHTSEHIHVCPKNVVVFVVVHVYIVLSDVGECNIGLFGSDFVCHLLGFLPVLLIDYV